MRDSIHPARLTRSRRAHLLAVALLLSVVSIAGCTGSSGTTARGAATASGAATPAGVVSGCASCIAPHLFRVAYGIQPLLDRGIDGRGETVTVLDPAPPPSAPAASSPTAVSSSAPAGSSTVQGPNSADIRQALKAFDSMFKLPAARLEVVTTLAGSASPWQATSEEIQDVETVHAVAPAATLRVVLIPSDFLDSAATATADMIAGLRLAVSGTDVVSISLSLGEHFSPRLRWPRCTPSCWERPLTTSRWSPPPVTTARSATPGSGARRPRRSAFRPPTRSCWPLAAPRSPCIPRAAPTLARPPGMARPALVSPAEHRGAASATCMPVPPIRMASPGSRR